MGVRNSGGFWGSNNLLQQQFNGNVICFFFCVRQLTTAVVQQIRQETSKILVNAVFHRWCSHGTTIAVRSCGSSEANIWFFLLLDCAAGSQLRVHESTALVVSGCLRLLSGAGDALTHPIRSMPQFRGLWLLARSYSCPQVKCKPSSGGCYFVSLRVFRSSINVDHSSTPK